MRLPIGILLVKGDVEEISLNYGFDKEKSKVLYCQYRRKIPNILCGTIFNRHISMIKSGELHLEFLQLYFFLPSVTDRSEEINQYLQNFSITPINIKQQQQNAWAQNGVFKPAKLD